ncbi:sickle tail protein homolog isoform X10 [Heterocephalus glaber]|uniref:Sickle tail protein homolog isoform X10 n=1 Tax=Heterocephalus glaber TaxID=10181 RepID=A0AAX6RHE7_HETGA|nr:sickle tail protein homolog isoform X10 [Heterocephalus glaber]
MQTSEMDRKREAFLEHLKQKYPHHATAIMGHQERLRDQTRSPKLSHSPQPPTSGDLAEHLSETSGDSLEAMSEGEVPSPFSRGSRTRASLPVVRSANQTKERSLGVLYLQYGDETKQLRMPNEITSTDTIRALFVSAFPQQLTMKMLESPSVAIYIKDESRNVYYELNDVRNIQDRSLLKVYNKDPSHAFNHTSKTVNGDLRMQREIVYARGDGPGSPRPGAPAPPHALPHSPPPTPGPHSMPPSPSRIPYGGARPMVVPGNATIPRDRLSSLPVSRSISPSPSAILERRDVKPDEDLSGKTLAMYRNEALYADPYLYHEGRMSIASSHGGHPLDVPDHIIAYHRTAIRSASAYCNPSLQAEMHMEQSLYRQKSRKYPESHLPTLGSKTPPASPHRVGDLRMLDLHPHPNAHGAPHTLQPDRTSPGRQSFRKEPGTLVYIEKPRSTPGMAGLVDLGPPLVEKQVFAYSTATIPKDRETSEKMMKTTANRSHTDSAGTPHAPGGKTLECTTPSGQALPPSTSAIHMSLLDMKRNVAELRLQLQQMRQLQLQNQELLRAMLKKAELEISSKVMETMKRLEDPAQRQRTLVEQERQKYLREEERIVKKLGELENFVEDLKKDSSSAGRVVTLKAVEDGAFLLRQVGEAVATLKGEFPTLQNKMRAVLRIEVEAVRFLKEEPHKLDSLLKRVRSMTDVLTVLRRRVTDGLLKGTDATQAAQYMAMEKATAAEVLKDQEEAAPAPGQPRQCPGAPGEVRAEVLGLSATTPHRAPGEVRAEVLGLSATTPHRAPGEVRAEVLGLSATTPHRTQSSPVVVQPSQRSLALPNPAQSMPAGGPDPYTASPPGLKPEVAPAAQSPQAPVGGAATQSLFIEEIHSASAKNRAVSIEKAERKWEEKRQNLEHYNGKEFEKLLEEAQANIMKSIPNLEMPPKGDAPVEKPELSEDSPDSEQDPDKLGGKPSPPPPTPPRRSYLPGLGLTTTRSGDVVYTSRKDSTSSKASGADAGQSPQSRTTKCAVEEAAAAWPPSPPLAVTSSWKDEEEEEEEGEKLMAELQAFQKCSLMDINSHSHAEQSRADSHVNDTRPGATALPKEKKASSGTPPTSRMPVPMSSKSRPASLDKPSKQSKLQDPRQLRQANGSAKKAGGDCKPTSPSLPASKIPALSPSSGKSSSLPSASADGSNLPHPPAAKPATASNPLSPQAGRPVLSLSACLIPSVPNGSLKSQSPAAHAGKGPHPGSSPQTPNGRAALSPPSLTQGARAVRIVHAPSLTSYKAQNGSSGKATPSTAKETS